MEAVDNGLLDLHRFEAGGAERIGGLEPENQNRRPKEFFEDLFWEFLDLIGEAVADGATNPLFDQMSGDLLRTGVEAGRQEEAAADELCSVHDDLIHFPGVIRRNSHTYPCDMYPAL